ncbi:hypothetical protein GCM10022220_39700 [Actinocatenispora rupis]|uniref:Uncharacterized protein n=2 Tax=Actinocatenispora rupis TaxID=519421 RepID=A0A8J3IVE6_9ACTN|nr:hypothetical protein Aru02nite_03620 [Actinocatenispora rupis]
MRDGFYARWRGAEYEAAPSSGGAHLYSGEGDLPGFEAVASGRYRRIVSFSDLDEFGYVITAGALRGEPVKVLAEHEEWLRVEYTGGRAPRAERLGLDRFDRGVYQSWVLRTEVTDLHEVRL